jgi:hypothetical protein
MVMLSLLAVHLLLWQFSTRIGNEVLRLMQQSSVPLLSTNSIGKMQSALDDDR